MQIEPARQKAGVPEAVLTRCLAEIPASVVLRNEEDLFDNLQRGGDIDLLVTNLEHAEQVLVRHLGTPVRWCKRSYVTEYAYEWGSIDLLPTIEWRGAIYLPTDAILDHGRLSRSARRVPRPAHEAVVSWLTSLLWGGFFNPRYAAVIGQAVAADGVALRQALLEAAGTKWGSRLWDAAAGATPEISAGWTRQIRRAVWWRCWRHSPLRTSARYLGFVIAELRLRLAPPVPWIAILGSDGSGKSSVVTELVRRFRSCSYGKAVAFHCRPRLIARPQSGEPVTDPHGRPCRGRVASALSLLVLTTDWLVGYWTRLVHLRAKGHVLAFDRMYFDLVVDPKRYRYGAGRGLARASWSLLPRPDLIFLLDTPPEVLWRRKQEVPLSELARQRDAFNSLMRDLPDGHVLDGTRTITTLVDEIDGRIREWMENRSRSRLSRLWTPLPASRDTAEATAGAAIGANGSDGRS